MGVGKPRNSDEGVKGRVSAPSLLFLPDQEGPDEDATAAAESAPFEAPAVACPLCRRPLALTEGVGPSGEKKFLCPCGHKFLF